MLTDETEPWLGQFFLEIICKSAGEILAELRFSQTPWSWVTSGSQVTFPPAPAAGARDAKRCLCRPGPRACEAAERWHRHHTVLPAPASLLLAGRCPQSTCHSGLSHSALSQHLLPEAPATRPHGQVRTAQGPRRAVGTPESPSGRARPSRLCLALVCGQEIVMLSKHHFLFTFLPQALQGNTWSVHIVLI